MAEETFKFDPNAITNQTMSFGNIDLGIKTTTPQTLGNLAFADTTTAPTSTTAEEEARDRLVVSRPEETIVSDKERLAQMSADLEAAKKQAEQIQKELEEKQVTTTKTDTTGGLTDKDKADLGVTTEEAIPQNILDLAGGDENLARQLNADPILKMEFEFMNSKKERFQNQIDTLRGGTIDPATQAVIDRINDTFQRRIAQQQDINRSRNAFETTRMLRGGTTQYAGSIAEGIVRKVEEIGLDKVLELENQRNALIAEAIALDKKERNDLVNEKLAEIDEIEETKIAELSKLNKAMIEGEKKQTETYNKIAKQNNIAAMFESGITNPFEILTQLNKDEEGEFTGDYSLDEITEVLDAIKGTAAKPESQTLKDFEYLKETNQLPAGVTDYMQYKRMIEETEKTPKSTKLSILDLRRIEEDYGIKLPIGSTFEDAERLQAEKFIDDNKDKIETGEVSGQEVVDVITDKTNLSDGEAWNILEKFAVGVYRSTNRILGIGQPPEPTKATEETKQSDLDALFEKYK